MRIAPNYLICGDPAEVRRMWAVRSPFDRSPWYKGFQLEPPRDCTLSMRDNELHTVLRSKLAPGVRLLSCSLSLSLSCLSIAQCLFPPPMIVCRKRDRSSARVRRCPNCQIHPAHRDEVPVLGHGFPPGRFFSKSAVSNSRCDLNHRIRSHLRVYGSRWRSLRLH